MPSKGTYNRGSLTDAVKGMFISGTEFRTPEGRLKDVYRPLAFRRGKMVDGVNVGGYFDKRSMQLSDNFSGSGKRHFKYTDKSGKLLRTGWWTKSRFGATLGGGKGFIELKDMGEVALQLDIASHYVDIAMDDWKNAIVQRAMKVFQESFEAKKFNSAKGGKRWPRLRPATVKKRKKMGLWPGQGGMLEATGSLRKSLEIEKTGAGYAITTKPVNYLDGRTRVYAGVHNDPKFFGAGHYPNGTPYAQRKFMGHSTQIDEFILKYQSRYLFDNVFRRRM